MTAERGRTEIQRRIEERIDVLRVQLRRERPDDSDTSLLRWRTGRETHRAELTERRVDQWGDPELVTERALAIVFAGRSLTLTHDYELREVPESDPLVRTGPDWPSPKRESYLREITLAFDSEEIREGGFLAAHSAWAVELLTAFGLPPVRVAFVRLCRDLLFPDDRWWSSEILSRGITPPDRECAYLRQQVSGFEGRALGRAGRLLAERYPDPETDNEQFSAASAGASMRYDIEHQCGGWMTQIDRAEQLIAEGDTAQAASILDRVLAELCRAE